MNKSATSVADYQRAKADYLNTEFPCEVSGWHHFSSIQQNEMKERQRNFLASLGYREQPDGSFIPA